MTEPAQSDATICRLVIRQLTDHLRLRARMAEHVYEIEYDHIQVIPPEIFELLHELLSSRRVVYLMI